MGIKNILAAIRPVTYTYYVVVAVRIKVTWMLVVLFADCT